METNDIVSPDVWRTEGEALAAQHKAQQWAVADWLLAGLEVLPAPEVYAAAERFFPQYSKATLMTFASVARTFSPLMRNKALTFSHHHAVMGAGEGLASELSQKIKHEWLEKAAAGEWSVATLRANINHEFELWEWAKAQAKAGADGEAEIETEEAEASPLKRRTQATKVFTLSHLSPSYRAKLEKLAVARRMPVDTLAKILIENALEDAADEIAVIEARAAEAAQKAQEEAARMRDESRLNKANKVALEIGWDVDSVLAAAHEFDARIKAQPNVVQIIDGCFSPWSYAKRKLTQSEEKAWAEHENWKLAQAVPEEAAFA